MVITNSTHSISSQQAFAQAPITNANQTFQAKVEKLPESRSLSADNNSVAPTNYASHIKSVLTPDAQGNLHEEEMQFGIVSYLLAQKDPQLSQSFQDSFNTLIGSGNPPLLTEDAVKVALQQLVTSQSLDLKTAESINGVSFRAAQLDSDLSALFDSRGGANDHTIAVMNFSDAVKKTEAVLQAIEDGSLPIQARALTAPSNAAPSGSHGSASGGSSGGFLWKPVSEADGRLVVLLPASLTGQIQSAAIHRDLPPSAENRLESGRFAGDTHNGGRAHFRFNKPGGGYPDGVQLVATLKNGQTVSFQIEQTSARDTR